MITIKNNLLSLLSRPQKKSALFHHPLEEWKTIKQEIFKELITIKENCMVENLYSLLEKVGFSHPLHPMLTHITDGNDNRHGSLFVSSV